MAATVASTERTLDCNTIDTPVSRSMSSALADICVCAMLVVTVREQAAALMIAVECYFIELE